MFPQLSFLSPKRMSDIYLRNAYGELRAYIA